MQFESVKPAHSRFPYLRYPFENLMRFRSFIVAYSQRCGIDIRVGLSFAQDVFENKPRAKVRIV